MKTKLSLLAFVFLPSFVFSGEIVNVNGNCYDLQTIYPNLNTASCTTTYGIQSYSRSISTVQEVGLDGFGAYSGGTYYPLVLKEAGPYPANPLYNCYINYYKVPAPCPLPPPPDLSQYNNDFSGCLASGGTVTNMHFDSNAPFGFGFDCSATNASILALPAFQKPEDCDANGGYVMLSGGSYKCGTLGDVFGEIVTNTIGLLPAFGLFKSNKLKALAQSATLDKFKELAFNPTKPDDTPNMHVGLPRLPSPSAAQGGAKPSVPVTDSPPPTNSSGHVNSQPEVTIDTAYNHISDTYIPVKPSGDPIIDYSVVDRVNTVNQVSSAPKLADVIPQTGTTQKPVKETFDFSKIIANSQEPSTIATVPQTTTRTTQYSGTDPVEVVTVTRTYPDSSSAEDVFRINTATKDVVLVSTVLSPEGDSSTIYKTFTVPDLVVTPTQITGSLPTTANPVPDTGVTTTPPDSPAIISNPDAVSNQSLDTLINAQMPAYSLPSTGDFIPFDSNPITNMIDSATELFSNIEDQISSTKTVFDDTLLMINGGWTPPVIPAGACGDALAFNFHGTPVDLCPPLVNTTSSFSPIISSIVTVGGMALSISIILGGF